MNCFAKLGYVSALKVRLLLDNSILFCLHDDVHVHVIPSSDFQSLKGMEMRLHDSFDSLQGTEPMS